MWKKLTSIGTHSWPKKSKTWRSIAVICEWKVEINYFYAWPIFSSHSMFRATEKLIGKYLNFMLIFHQLFIFIFIAYSAYTYKNVFKSQRRQSRVNRTGENERKLWKCCNFFRIVVCEERKFSDTCWIFSVENDEKGERSNFWICWEGYVESKKSKHSNLIECEISLFPYFSATFFSFTFVFISFTLTLNCRDFTVIKKTFKHSWLGTHSANKCQST